MRLIKKISTLLIIVSIISMYTLSAQTEKSSKYTVVLDAGHGGKDSGARGLISMEKDIVLDIVLQIGQYLEEYNSEINVVYTRKDDTFIELYERADIAIEAEADLFVSIHANASPNKNSYGTETFVMGLHKTDGNLEVAKKENAVITLEDDYTEKYEGYDPHSAESYIIFSLMQNIFLDQSLQAADFVQTEFREKAHRRDRGVKQAGFLVLWKTTMPSVLVEIGFLSNMKEEQYLNSEQGKDYIASAIYRAIRTYFENRTENSNSQNTSKKRETENNSVPITSNTHNVSGNEEQNNTQKVTDTKQDVFFTVQLTASTSDADLKAPPFNQLEGSITIKKIGKYNKYFYGEVVDYNDAKKLQKMCLAHFPDAFIVAFDGENPISIAKAILKQ